MIQLCQIGRNINTKSKRRFWLLIVTVVIEEKKTRAADYMIEWKHGSNRLNSPKPRDHLYIHEVPSRRSIERLLSKEALIIDPILTSTLKINSLIYPSVPLPRGKRQAWMPLVGSLPGNYSARLLVTMKTPTALLIATIRHGPMIQDPSTPDCSLSLAFFPKRRRPHGFLCTILSPCSG